jgi:hypothetical protein
MTCDRKRQFFWRNATPIIGNRNAIDATAVNRDLNTPRTCIDRVLNKFLDHACGSLNYLAGGNLVDKLAREETDRHPWIVKITVSTGLKPPSMPHYAHGNAQDGQQFRRRTHPGTPKDGHGRYW